ncbi:MAG: cobalamin-dependent protein [Spirochaetota bacterium]
MIQATEESINRLEQALLSLDRIEFKRLMTGRDGNPLPIQEIEAVIVPTLERIGSGWEEGRISLSQVYMSGRLCEELIDAILPFSDTETTVKPSMAIAALGDYHLLGTRLVYSVLHSSGFKLLNYGRQDTDALAEKIKADGITIMLVSVLMLNSALHVKDLRTRLNDSGCKVKLVVGGAPFRLDKQLWSEVGADATSNTAAGAADTVRRLIQEA